MYAICERNDRSSWLRGDGRWVPASDEAAVFESTEEAEAFAEERGDARDWIVVEVED